MTITVRLPDELEARLRKRVADESIELSEFIRQAITDKLAVEPPPPKHTAYDVWKKCFTGRGSGDPMADGSGESNRSERDEEILRAHFDAERRSRQ